MNKEQNDLNVDFKSFEQCIKTESDFTNTKYHNICTGEVSVVPTGVFDYMIGIPIIISLVIMCIGFLKMIFD